MHYSAWSRVTLGPPDSILGIAQAFAECPDLEKKVNVCVGAYRDERGQPWVLPTVQAAEERMLLINNNSKEYLPIEGDKDFVAAALKFAYGADADLSRLAAVQSLSGTGACRIGGHFLQKFFRPFADAAVDSAADAVVDDSPASAAASSIYLPVPTWGNHWKIFAEAGLNAQPYRYYDADNQCLDLAGLLHDLEHVAPDGSIVLLHACAHNPTGCDPSQSDWEQIVLVLRRKRHVAFFDSAYQGFASGHAERDAWALRYVVAQGDIPVLLAQSFAKNFGLYGERCGTLSVVCNNSSERDEVVSQLKGIVRPMYSSPPRHGSSIVKTILTDPNLTAQYHTECQHMADRIAAMRALLVEELVQAGSPREHWTHILGDRQIGMFAYTGMTPAQCDALTDQYSIFLTLDGRISLAGLNESNIRYVAEAMHAVTTTTKTTTPNGSPAE